MDLADQLLEKLKHKKWKLVTVESCTGGMISASITDKAGSSEVFDRGFVTYSNQAKMDCLGVSAATLEKHGAVSAQTAEEMAKGALEHSEAEISVAVTGVAGPGGGTADKPVGLVYIAYGIKGGFTEATAFSFNDTTRQEVRENTVVEAFKTLLALL